jgi:hypothetical protein
MVEKRLKQNREAARRSRDRKRKLKESLQQRMPLLQSQHDRLLAAVDKLMQHMWVWHQCHASACMLWMPICRCSRCTHAWHTA